MSDEKWMRKALSLAALARGSVEPNPMVGAVLVRDGCVLGEGCHRRFGQAHAEIEALRQVQARGIDPAGSALFVTLEPCAHQGQTPPCTLALIRAKLRRIVVAMPDPFPEVAGAGIEMLRQARIEVEVGICAEEARHLNEAYLKRIQTGLPWVIVKWAQTLDGKIATSTGQSRWISGEGARRRVHELRARVDAIMVGMGTVLADDPRLTARGVEIRRVARRVVVDRQLKISTEARLIEQPDPPVLVATGQAAVESRVDLRREWERRGIELVGLPPHGRNHLELRLLLLHLASQYDATNVLLEGGPSLIGSFFAQDLVDQVLVFVAPKILGDAKALPAVRGFTRQKIADASQLDLRSLERIGDDVMLDYRLKRPIAVPTGSTAAPTRHGPQ